MTQNGYRAKLDRLDKCLETARASQSTWRDHMYSPIFMSWHPILNMSYKLTELIGIATKKLQRTGMTTAGQRWLVNALDPFHDTDVRCDGLPDGSDLETINVVIKGQTTVGPPAFVGDAAAWDLQIVAFNEDLSNYNQMGDVSTYTAMCDNDGPYIDIDAIVGVNDQWQGSIGSCAYAVVPTGYDAFPEDMAAHIAQLDAADAIAPHQWGVISSAGAQTEYQNHPFRVIGRAIECTMVGPEVTRSGTVTTARITGYNDVEQIFVHNEITRDNVADYYREFSVAYQGPMPPVDPATMRNLPGSRTWAARDGIYAVSTLNDPTTVKVEGSKYAARIFKAEDENAVSDDNSYGIGRFPLVASNCFAAATPDPELSRSSKMKCHPDGFNPHVITFTGLHPDDRVTITTRELIEMLPNPNDVLFQELASRSPRYDPVAIQLYRIIAPMVPSGVPVGMNAKGDYWNIMMKLLDAAIPILRTAPGPIGPILGTTGTVVRYLAPVVRKKIKRAIKQRRQRKAKR